jgi:mRNA interferase RelE/StbE
LYGKALQGNRDDQWRYRVGDYRILAKIDDDVVIITVVEVGHRKEIY